MDTNEWTEEQILIFRKFAYGDDAAVNLLLSHNSVAVGMVTTIMKNKLVNPLIRELVACNIENLEHNNDMHGYDAWHPTKLRWAEMKNEQHNSSIYRDNQITGGGVFGGAVAIENVNQYVHDNPVIYLSGWVDGRLAYTLEFDFNDTNIANRLYDTIRRRNNGAKTGPKFMWSDWAYAKSLRVSYLNEIYFNKLRPVITSALFRAIKSQWYNHPVSEVWPAATIVMYTPPDYTNILSSDLFDFTAI